jgi:hypothetical protein
MATQTLVSETEPQEDPRLEAVMVVLLLAILATIGFAHFSSSKSAERSEQSALLTIVQSGEIEW